MGAVLESDANITIDRESALFTRQFASFDPHEEQNIDKILRQRKVPTACYNTNTGIQKRVHKENGKLPIAVKATKSNNFMKQFKKLSKTPIGPQAQTARPGPTSLHSRAGITTDLQRVKEES